MRYQTKGNRSVQVQKEMSKYGGQRIHHSQISDSDKKLLLNRLSSIRKWNISGHALDRLSEKGINATKQDIISTINNCSIVEYKIDYNRRYDFYEERVVVRANAVVNRVYNLNVVFSLGTNSIITVWINHVKDFHNTLDWSIYNKDMKVFVA